MALVDGSRASARSDRLRALSRRERGRARGRRRARAGRQGPARSLSTGRGRVRVGNRVRTAERGAYPSVRVYLSPANLITSGNLLAGFLALLVAAQGHAGWAAGLVIAAGICDSLDGLVARRTDSESAFGSRLDSLADLVSFGAAPALVLYVGVLDAVPVGGTGACLAFVLGGAWRLARFSLVENRHYFVGLPIPPAGVIAVLLGVSAAPPLAVCLITAVLAGLMTSTVPFPTFATLFRPLRQSPTRDGQVTASSDVAGQAPPASG